MDSRPSSASRTRNLCRLEAEGTDSFAIGATSAIMASTSPIHEQLRGFAVFMMKAAEHWGDDDASVGGRCRRSVRDALPDSLVRT